MFLVIADFRLSPSVVLSESCGANRTFPDLCFSLGEGMPGLLARERVQLQSEAPVLSAGRSSWQLIVQSARPHLKWVRRGRHDSITCETIPSVHPSIVKMSGVRARARDVFFYDLRDPSTLLGGLVLSPGVTNANFYSMVDIVLVISSTYFLQNDNGQALPRDSKSLLPGDYFVVTAAPSRSPMRSLSPGPNPLAREHEYGYSRTKYASETSVAL